MEHMRFFYMANDAANSMRKLEDTLFGSISPDGGILSDLDTQIHYMTAMHLAEMKSGEWYESDKTLGAAASFLSVENDNRAKAMEEMDKIVDDYLKSENEES